MLYQIFIKSYRLQPTTTFKILKFNPGSPLRLVCLYFHTMAQSASLCLSLLGHLLLTHNAFFQSSFFLFTSLAFAVFFSFSSASVLSSILIDLNLSVNLQFHCFNVGTVAVYFLVLFLYEIMFVGSKGKQKNN